MEDEAFTTFKNALTTNCMAYFNTSWSAELIVDASLDGISAVLAQINPNNHEDRKFVTFDSRQLTDVAAVWGCERLWIYLFGREFKLVTDNRAVQLIFGNATSRPSARIERLALRLTQFDYVIENRSGLSNIADYSSRHDKKTDLAALAKQQSTEHQCNRR